MSREELPEQQHRKAPLEIYERLKLERDTAIQYYQLGRAALERYRLDEAEQWHQKALEIWERLKLEGDAASDYHELGNIAARRSKLDEAEKWYQKALEIYERLRLERDTAVEYHGLGNIAQRRNKLDKAEQWYRKALEIYERLGLERDVADECHELGTIAARRNRLDDEEKWRRRALEIYERLGLERDAAHECHELGTIAGDRYRLNEAEKWFRKALEIYEHIGDPPLMVNTFAGFGLLRWQQNKRDEAVSWFGRAWAIATEYQMQIGQQIQIYLARTMKAMGEKEFTKAWRKAFKDKEAPLTDLHKTLEKLRERTSIEGDTMKKNILEKLGKTLTLLISGFFLLALGRFLNNPEIEGSGYLLVGFAVLSLMPSRLYERINLRRKLGPYRSLPQGNGGSRPFLERYGLILTLLIFGIPLVVVIPLLMLITSGSLFSWLIGEAMFGGVFLFIALAILWQAKKKKLWKEDVAAELGLNYRTRGLPSMDGVYRNHYVEIFLEIGGEEAYTGCRVVFNNPSKILMHLYKERLFRKIGEKLIVKMQDIKVGDPEFDQRFVIKGSSESDIKAILDPFIRNRIMDIKNFHDFKMYGKEPHVAHYEERGFVTDTKRLRSILDLMIDVVEKIEKG